MLSKNAFLNCDILENIPQLNRENYLQEIKLLKSELLQNTSVLQVGSMDGTRIIHLLEVRPDLKITGLEIEPDLAKLAEEKIAAANLAANFICGDITNPPGLPNFDYVICLNNTLGYIPDYEKAIKEMKKLSKAVIISVYGEKFNDDLAREYFRSIELEIESTGDNLFFLKNFGTVKRFTRKEVESWSNKIIETPIGYFCIL